MWPWVDQRWIVARCTVTDPPGWLKKGTKASFSYRVLRSYEFNDWEIVSRALVDDVSIVSSSHKPIEPCTEVLLYRRANEPKPHRSEEIILDAGTLLVRPGIGSVIAVR